jgi:putative FmdB family regulatory protein
MPIYEYECLECGKQFERLQRFGDSGPVRCPSGHQQVHRLFSQPAIIFKGSGFYVTDNRRNGSTGSTRSTGSTATSDTSDKSEDQEKKSATTPQDEAS